MNELKVCNECGCKTYKTYPDPRDSQQLIQVCEDCDYAIQAVADVRTSDDYERLIDEYSDLTHGN